jgi:transposase
MSSLRVVWASPRPVKAWSMREVMPEGRRKYDKEFRKGRSGSSGRRGGRSPRSLATSGSTRAPWAIGWPGPGRGGEGEGLTAEREELKQLRKDVAERRMERDVLKRSVVLWVKEATR